ncbi:DinB family protein [Edaphobacter albus]|uniref:DinB family protein n=1 Tax=Edaphobacter sp. 4G125 TaxID=2763071 RepID=UPI0016488BB4|nr:DinB family protein [Edaphobacter sp. 4G125]QNI35906.1 DinB family protein [Edaphobacter sp. 4G125]
MASQKIEPWLRGTHIEVDAVRRAVLHALELAAEDIARWCEGLNGEEMEARPMELPSVGFQLRHMVRSLDRLLTYADGQQLTERQLKLLKSEEEFVDREATLMEFAQGIEVALKRVLAFSEKSYDQPRAVGRKKLPTTVGGLLVHCADHTQRHVGQAITTTKVVMAMRGK